MSLVAWGKPPEGAIFLPGYFVGTNHMLSDQRAAGEYRGRRAGVRAMLGRQPDVRGVDHYAAEVRRVRRLAADAVQAFVLTNKLPTPPLWLGFFLLGREHAAMDPTAWYLPGKAAEDGMQKGGLFKSDRFDVAGSCGFVCRSVAESEAFYRNAMKRAYLRVPGMVCAWWSIGRWSP